MIKKSAALLCVISFLFSCKPIQEATGVRVTNTAELTTAIANAKPGDEIIMSNGEWNNVEIKFVGYGTAKKPITLKAETAGNVILKGKSNLKLGGEYLVVDGLLFTDGSSPSESVITFAINNDTVANHSRVANSVILDYNKAQRNQMDLWVLFKGRYNSLENCYIAGKSNKGPTVRVDLAGNENSKNYHKIMNNYFGPRPPKGGPSAETIQIGNSFTSMVPSYTLVEHNLFDRCNGEVEIISSKSNFNEFRQNVFYKSEGSLVTRHGNYCTIDSNYFIGDDNSEQIGGIRLIGTGHWVTNNYFYNLKGKIFRSPLAVMNGIPKSPLNRYIQVTDVVVAHNSFVNCIAPLQFGVGSNIDQKEVLPASEIRSERPIRTIVANNLIFNSQSDAQPVIAHDSLDGITFKSNLINNQGVNFKYNSGFTKNKFTFTELQDNVLIPSTTLPQIELYKGFEFEHITTDMFGSSRKTNNSAGAVVTTPNKKSAIIDLSQYGPEWYKANAIENKLPKTYTIHSATALKQTITNAKSGDTIQLTSGVYEFASPLKIDKKLTITSPKSTSKTIIRYTGTADTPAFEMNPKGMLTLNNIHLQGTGKQYAFASLQNNMSSLYNLTVTNSEISNFEYVVRGYKYSFAEYITFKTTIIKNCTNGIVLAAEDDDKGEYNAENLTIEHCSFNQVKNNVVNYYRGGYDESTVGGNLVISNSTFTNCGANQKNEILLNTYGIINVRLTANTFLNNNVDLVARLWGAKNNNQEKNKLHNSGKLTVEENLPLKLMY